MKSLWEFRFQVVCYLFQQVSLAEGERFELSVPDWIRRLSRAVH